MMATETRTPPIHCEALTAAENRAARERARSKALKHLARLHDAEYHELLAVYEAQEGVAHMPRGPKPAWTKDPDLQPERTQP